MKPGPATSSASTTPVGGKAATMASATARGGFPAFGASTSARFVAQSPCSFCRGRSSSGSGTTDGSTPSDDAAPAAARSARR